MLAEDNILLLPAIQFRWSQFAHRRCSVEFCSQVRSSVIIRASLSAIFMFICETNSQPQPRHSQQVQTRWLPGWLAIFPVCCLPRLGAFTKEFGGGGWRGLSFNGRHGMGWNSFSLPAFFIHSLTLFSHYPFHHGRWSCAPRAGNQTKWVEGHCCLQESPCAVRNLPS